MNANIGTSHVRHYNLQDQLSYWRQRQENARKLGLKDEEKQATDRLRELAQAGTQQNTDALNIAEQVRRKELAQADTERVECPQG
jgi:hypothetical protein